MRSSRSGRWLSHLVRLLDERLPKRVLFGRMDGSGVRGKSETLGTNGWSVSRRPAICMAFIHMVEESTNRAG